MGFFSEMKTILRKNIRDYGMYIALVVIVIVFSVMSDGLFISSRNISNLINQTGYIAVLAVGMTLIIVIRHIDLSVGYIAGFTGAIAAIMMTQWNLSEWLVIPLILLIGLVIGLVNGVIVAKIGVPAFVVSLAGMMIFRGLLLQATIKTGTIIVPNSGFNAIGNGFIPSLAMVGGLHLLTLLIGIVGIVLFIISEIKNRRNLLAYNFEVTSKTVFLLKLVFVSVIIGGLVWILANYNGISWTLVVMGIVVFIYHFVTTKTSLGRHIYGVGGNPEAAELSGVNVKKVTIIVFASMSMLAALAGILYTSRQQSALTTAGLGFELDAIAAAYVGGVSANGGVGKVTGSIIGAFVMASLSNGMNLLNVDISYQYVIRGAILVLAVVFDIYTRKTRGSKKKEVKAA